MDRISKRVNGRSDKGFTLIELLVVVIILGILSGIAVFSVSAFQDDALLACGDANDRITATAEAAEDASGTDSGSYTATEGECEP